MSELTLEKQSSTTDFVGGKWQSEINVRDFIQKNYTPYDGDSSFLAGPTEATTKLWQECCDLFKKERENGGVLDMDTKIVSTITSHKAGYIDKSLEQIVGLQTDKPLNVLYNHLVVSEWLKLLANLMVTKLTQKLQKFSQNTEKLTTKVFSIAILLK